MGWIVGGIDINYDLPAPGQDVPIAVCPRMVQVKQGVFIHAVFKSAEGRLGSQLLVKDIVEEGSFLKIAHLIAVLVSLYEGKHALTHKLFDRMGTLTRSRSSEMWPLMRTMSLCFRLILSSKITVPSEVAPLAEQSTDTFVFPR